ncbi:flippase [Tamlana flava]|uniref:flippase n=1 Tax=Tamlana flava TaxID=3158572 RepID=UPI00351B7A4E
MTKHKDKNLIELVKGGSVSLVIKLMGMLFGYLSMLFITKYFGAEEWGVYSLCITVLSVAIIFPKFGFDTSLVRIIAELNVKNKQDQISGVLLRSTLISIALSLLVIVAITLFADVVVSKVIKQPEMLYYFKIISIAIIPMALLTIYSSLFQALKKTAFFMLFQATLINVVFFILLIFYYNFEIDFSGTFNLYVIAVFIVLISLILFLVITIKKLNTDKITKREKPSFGYLKIFKISFPMMMSSSFALLIGWVDIFMLSYYKTTTDIGIYNTTLKLAALSTITLMAVNAIATPKFGEFYISKNIAGLKETVKNSTKMIFLTSTPILLALIVFARPILGFFGEEFKVGYLSLIYLCISRFINAISGSVGYLMQMTDQQNQFQNVLIVAFVINLILNYLLIPKYSYEGAAIASGLSMIFWNLALVIIIKRKLGFWTFYNPLQNLRE